MEEERDLVVFSDDEGNEFELEIVDYFDYEGQEYAVLVDPESGCSCGCGCDCVSVCVSAYESSAGREKVVGTGFSSAVSLSTKTPPACISVYRAKTSVSTASWATFPRYRTRTRTR